MFTPDERMPVPFDDRDFDAVVCNGFFVYNDIKQFTNIKLIQAISAGLDRIPLDYVKEHNIKLYNARGVYSIPMAEWAVMRVLEIYKKSMTMYESAKQHNWEKQRELFEISGKTVCVVGMGSVGTEVAKRFATFDAKVIGVDIFKNDNKYYDECYLISELDEALKISDIVILTLPLTDETRGMFDLKRLKIMKDNSVLVNISRGPVIVEHDLIEALNCGKLMGVGLDVFESEPLSEKSPLWEMPNVLISPHNSFVSDRTNERMFEIIKCNLKEFAEEE
ncbi:MAG: NAD(P)-dependent oxidoreductase [Acutalibacteraceae bacterium]